MLKNIVFDLDGTLWQTEKSYIYAYHKLCDFYNIKEKFSDEIIRILEEDKNLVTTIGAQMANTIISQVEADENATKKIAIDADANITFMGTNQTKETLDTAYNLKDKVLTLEEKREILLKLEYQRDKLNDRK